MPASHPFKARFAALGAVIAMLAAPALAQTATAPAPAPLIAPGAAAMTQVQLLVADVDANVAFWTALGGKPGMLGPIRTVDFPGFHILLRKSDGVGPAAGTGYNHIGLHVPDVPTVIARWKAEGLKTQLTNNPQQAYVWSPGDLIQVEFLQDPTQTIPMTFHHVHVFVHANDAGGIPQIQAWYARMLGAIPGKRGRFDNDVVPGGELSFNNSDPPTAPTLGRAVESVGYSLKGLAAYCRKLAAAGVKFDVPYANGRAVITDPWGDRIELLEAARP